MKKFSRPSQVRIAMLLGAILAAGCSTAPTLTGAAGGGGGQSQAVVQAPAAQGNQLERQLTLHVDPAAGTISAVDDRGLQAVIESDLAIDFEAVNLAQSGDTTNMVLVAHNHGSNVSDLAMSFGGQRSVTSPTGRVDLGAVPTGSDVQQSVSFSNPGGGAFNVSVSIWATLDASGVISSNGSGASVSPTLAPTATPTPVATVAPTATPTPAPTATATVSPTTSPTVAPSALPTAHTTPPPPVVANPGPGAVRGRILMNGAAPFRAFSLTLVRTQNGSWTSSQTISSDSQGNFSASGLAAGDYLVYFYNDSQRDVIGYWSSRTLHVDSTTGAAFPAIDFYQAGMQNVPAMDAHVHLPQTFQWVPQTQTVQFYNWRLHSTSGRTFTLIYQSQRIDGSAASFTWDGAGTTLSPTNRYFWGYAWDAGAAGTGGNLYQAIYFQ